ncbi:phosphatidate cytidylyltransferase [Mucilaginibacter gotjawali]|uniref:Phosphatidate cytidylyltransferase n=1 Tax=Mucilaginibacter gotjawali TaxID=1550579 RepID=A0A839SIG1_9SPHI|nr:phosphatidate cytidylyltransferase [Mucilaginibacter gotjawali]MBB3056670.1 phosphatidate cytidylyltransferase [Mucilaginibacter gotjawali]
MKTRAITGFFFVIVMLASVLLGQFVFVTFYLMLSAFCLYEFYSLVTQNTAKPDIVLGIINGMMLFAGIAVLIFSDNITLLLSYKAAHSLLFLMPLTSALVFIRQLYNKSASPFNNIAYTYLGIVLVIVPFTFFHALAFVKGAYDFHFPLAFLILLWANDTGAYLVGMKFGRTKLFERHSPKKTWEGFIGGIIISAGVALILAHFYTELPWNQWVSIAIIISCIGTLGDLVESMFKRSINVKDSGGILPGHGGLLDRFDGLFLAAPIVYMYLYFIAS